MARRERALGKVGGQNARGRRTYGQRLHLRWNAGYRGGIRRASLYLGENGGYVRKALVHSQSLN
jgi:hypothetical protein